jgi:hypothetical protein
LVYALPCQARVELARVVHLLDTYSSFKYVIFTDRPND